MPPPGPERDAEIARLLGHYLTREDGSSFDVSDLAPPEWSTDPAACDRLEREMFARGWRLQAEADHRCHEATFLVVSGFSQPCVTYYALSADSRPDAVSAAALLALRGGR